MAGKFPPAYMGAVVQGQALGGIFAAATNVIMLACGADAVSAAFYDFLIAIIFLISALAAFVVLMRTEFFQYYANDSGNEATENEADKEDEQLIADQVPQVIHKTSTLAIVQRIWVWIVAVFLTFLVCLAVFPSITAQVQSTASKSAWSTTYFIPVGCFLLFNVGDYIGRMLASFVQWPKATYTGSLIILGLAVVRIGFIPLFLFCNAAPQNRDLTYVSTLVFIILKKPFIIHS